MKRSGFLRTSASILATGLMLSSGAAFADTNVVDGNGGGGVVVAAGQTSTVGTEDEETVYTNHTTTGGAGSGGGAGLGGVFFVDQGATLNLRNVSFVGNTVQGGEGGGVLRTPINNIVVSLPTVEVDAAPIRVVGITPTIQVSGGQVLMTGATLANANPMLGVGAGVSFENLLPPAAIGSLNGLNLTFAAPVAVSQSALRSLSIDSAHYTQTVTVSVPVYTNGVITSFQPQQQQQVVLPPAGTSNIQVSPNLSGSDLSVGMVVYGNGIAQGTKITAINYDSNNNVASVTLSQQTIGAVQSFGAVAVNAFDADLYRATAANKIKPVGALTGFAVGMQVTGNGIPAGTTITNIANDGTLTLSNNVAPVGAFVASTNAANVGSNIINMITARNDLAVGMSVTGLGIPAGTTITSIAGTSITLSNPVTSAAAQAIANNNFVASFGQVISNNGSRLTLASVAGLQVGALMTGDGIPANAIITAINTSTNTVDYVIDPAKARLSQGGSMNNLTPTGVAGSNGQNGLGGSLYGTIVHDGEGDPGQFGYVGGNGVNAPGGNGGNGGNGTAAIPYNGDNTYALISSIAAVTTGGLEWAAALSADPFPDFAEAAALLTGLSFSIADLTFAVADNVNWYVELGLGTVALGGDGGNGGNGGLGATFYGGGAGGNGGNGGNGGTSLAAGGVGGDGGTGGNGGFGAGGGSGGAPGRSGSTGGTPPLGGPGDGGLGGFGAGDGSDGLNRFGGGGSGFGGAIFVRSGGTLTITGNSLFESNEALAGSSNNNGSAGQNAGTDLFMMRGSNVTLAPGAGNTITFRGSIADDSAESIDGPWAAGNGANIQITGGGLVQFEGENTYSGRTFIGGATLEAGLGNNIAATSRLVFNGSGTSGSNLSSQTAGVLLTSGEINNRIGSALPGQISWTGSGGFAAGDEGLVLNFGQITESLAQPLGWNANGFVPGNATLIFGSQYGTGAVTFLNNVNLNGLTGRIAVYDNLNSDNDWAVLAGNYNNGSLMIGSQGYNGSLFLTGQNNLSSLTLNSGIVSTRFGEDTGRLFSLVNGGNLTVNRGMAILGGPEQVNALNVGAAGIVSLTQEFSAEDGGFINSIDNGGLLNIGGALATSAITNRSTGIINALADIESNNGVNNAGNLFLAGNLSAGGALVNDGAIIVKGTVISGTETATTRTLSSTGLSGAGIIQIGSNAGTMANVLNLEQSGDSVFGGSIIGAGSFSKLGDGILTLTGSNSFTGGLLVSDGTVDTTGGGTFANTLDATIAAGARLIVGTVDEIRSITNRGILTANADLIVTSLVNSGVSAMNTDFGARGNVSNVSGGSLTFSAGNEAVLAGNITNAGALVSSGALSVVGNVTNAAGGTLTLQSGGTNTLGSLTNNGTVTTSAAVTVTGALIQNAGTLSVGSSLATGSLSGTGGTINLGSNALTINQSANGTYSGAITGTSTITKNGTGTLTLAGATGSFAAANLSIQQGTVAVNGAGILDSALSVNVAANGNLTLLAGNQTIRNLSGTGALALNGNNLSLAQGGNFAGTVTGSGNVQVTSGTFNLANTINSTAGIFTVQPTSTMNVATTGTLNAPAVNVSGALNVLGIVNTATNNVNGVMHLGNTSGTIAGTVNATTTSINNGGLLSGVGAVRGLVTVGGTSAGALRPGNSPGTLNLDNLTLGALSTTTMEVEGASAGSYDLINLTGALRLQSGSSLVIANSNSFELGLGQKIKLFNFAPGSVNGQFGSVTSQFGRAVAFNLATGSVVGFGSLSSDAFETSAAISDNDRAMFNALRVSRSGGVNQYYGGRFIEHVSAAMSTGNTTLVAAAIAKSSPEDYTGLDMHIRLSMLENRLQLGGYENVDAPTYFATGSFVSNSERNENEVGYSRYTSSGQHFNIGAAAQFPFGKVQISYGRADGNLNGDYLQSGIVGDQASVGLSTPIAMNGALRIQSRLSYGDYTIDGKRGTNDGVASFSNVGGTSVLYGGGFEYFQTGKKLSVAATVELLAGRTKVDNFRETGASSLENLNIGHQWNQFAMLVSNLELGYQLTPSAQLLLTLGLDQDLKDNAEAITAHVANETTSFTVKNHGITSTRAKVGVGTRISLSDNMVWTSEANIGNASTSSYKTSVSIRF